MCSRQSKIQTAGSVEEARATRADGNGVNADVEYTELTRTALQYQYLVQSMSADITRYRSAIKGQ